MNNYEETLLMERDVTRKYMRLLRWSGYLERASIWVKTINYLVFLVMVLIIPAIEIGLKWNNWKTNLRLKYETVAQISLTIAATISYIFFNHLLRTQGLQTLLFFDTPPHKTRLPTVYTDLYKAFRNTFWILVAVCLIPESIYKIYVYYKREETRIEFLVLGNVIASDIIGYLLSLSSWLYRIVLYLVVCGFFRILCQIPLLRIPDGIWIGDFTLQSLKREHVRIKTDLRDISHWYRLFVLSTFALANIVLMVCLRMTTRNVADFVLQESGELVVCCYSLVVGLGWLLLNAARVTHQVQDFTGVIANMHASTTFDSAETLQMDIQREIGYFDYGEEKDVRIDPKYLFSCARNTMLFEERQAVVQYLDTNKAGITIYGFMLDRMYLFTVFGLEVSLVLWILGITLAKTLGIF